MKTMYKEEVTRRKLPSVLGFFLVLVAFIYVAEGVDQVTASSKIIAIIADFLLASIMISIMAYAVIRCNTKYRYSIIADQLIIHKIKSNGNIVVENIKLNDIEALEKKEDISSKFHINHTYNCSLLTPWMYCCAYRCNGKLKKFYFQPSENFILKLRRSLDLTNKVFKER
jgi:multisubunit Na+/H+ antiporter MnhG subunit